ncbi:hypothetical protein ECC02_005017 [Trypanosoma cruzi]|uniref:Uncharacterized protein n=1 Tax=Trypanosoma cruzi TaxID=5693 RepID=A0A7J6Y525_TRYCR|nr:hypothetical protein ECC02_005017 [Trypanosoma cruzi]
MRTGSSRLTSSFSASNVCSTNRLSAGITPAFSILSSSHVSSHKKFAALCLPLLGVSSTRIVFCGVAMSGKRRNTSRTSFTVACLSSRVAGFVRRNSSDVVCSRDHTNANRTFGAALCTWKTASITGAVFRAVVELQTASVQCSCSACSVSSAPGRSHTRLIPTVMAPSGMPSGTRLAWMRSTRVPRRPKISNGLIPLAAAENNSKKII